MHTIRSYNRGRPSVTTPANPTESLAVPTPGNTYTYIYMYVTPLRSRLGGHPVLSAHLNVKTAGTEPKRPEM